MIDFIKIYYRDKTNFEEFVLKEGNFENVYGQFDTHTGEIGHPYKTKFESMDYVVSQKTGYIKNSLHKLYNFTETGEDQNYNDFTFSNLCHSINNLLGKMVDIKDTRITQLEFGLNISTSISAEEIIRRNISMHKLMGCNHNRKFYGKGELKQFDHDNYFIKIYDKAKQYRKEFKLNQNILRFEIKFVKAKEFHKAGIFNILDLFDKSNLRRLFDILLERFDELTIIDDIDTNSLIELEDKIVLIEYMNPRFWESLKEQKKYQTRSRKKSEFEGLQRKYNLTQTKQNLRILLVDKFNFLIDN